MKMQLLGTTAIVGASLLFAAPALADKHGVTHGAKGTSVTLTGAFDFQAGWVDQDQEGGDQLGTPDRGYGFLTNSELAVNARGTTDAGMKWRAKVELETDENATGNVDELALTLSGSWGSLVMGSEDGPEDLMDYGADQAIGGAGSGGVSGDWKDWTNIASADLLAFVLGIDSRLIPEATLWEDSSDATKIVYYTPRINGFQLGVGYVPDTGAKGRKPGTDDAPGFSQQAEEFFGLGANYVQKFDGFNVAIGATGAIADAEADDVAEDLRAWRVGGVLGFGAFKIGAGYQDIGDSLMPLGLPNDEAWAFDVGIGFKQGPVKLGLGYLHAESGQFLPDEEAEHDVVTLGGTYTLGKGLVVYAEGWWYSSENSIDSFDDNDAFGVLIGTTVKF